MNFILRLRNLNKFLRSHIALLLKYKILNSILFTTAKLYKIGFKMNDSCSFCSSEPEMPYHFLYLCPYSIDFWCDFEAFWHQLLIENIRLLLQDVLVRMIPQNSFSIKLLNYLIMIGKLYLWDCRRGKILPNIYGFKKKIAVKYETEKYTSLHSKKTKDFFEAKWIVLPLVNAQLFKGFNMHSLSVCDVCNTN